MLLALPGKAVLYLSQPMAIRPSWEDFMIILEREQPGYGPAREVPGLSRAINW